MWKNKTAQGLALLGALLAITLGLCHIAPEAQGGDQAGVVMDLPLSIKGMIGFDQEISEAERILLPSDTEIVRKTYVSSSGDRIMASIV